MNIDDLNELCREIAEETSGMGFDRLIDEIEMQEEDEMMLSLGPRAFGPDFDDENGLEPYNWER